MYWFGAQLLSFIIHAQLIYIIYISAGQWLITINRIQNKSLCLHNTYVCTVYIY